MRNGVFGIHPQALKYYVLIIIIILLKLYQKLLFVSMLTSSRLMQNLYGFLQPNRSAPDSNDFSSMHPPCSWATARCLGGFFSALRRKVIVHPQTTTKSKPGRHRVLGRFELYVS
jgi:hypothetical protein